MHCGPLPSRLLAGGTTHGQAWHQNFSAPPDFQWHFPFCASTATIARPITQTTADEQKNPSVSGNIYVADTILYSVPCRGHLKNDIWCNSVAIKKASWVSFSSLSCPWSQVQGQEFMLMEFLYLLGQADNKNWLYGKSQRLPASVSSVS